MQQFVIWGQFYNFCELSLYYLDSFIYLRLRPTPIFFCSVYFMSPVSPVFHTIETVRLAFKFN